VAPEPLRRLARGTGLSRAAKSLGRRLGVDVVGRVYYSPIPDYRNLPDHVWEHERELRGVGFPSQGGLSLVRGDLAPYLAEYSPPRGPTGNPRDFHLDNGFYGSVDAELLYAMVRHLRPRRVIELGAGASTLVIADALERNGREAVDHRVFDPFPRAELAGTLAEIADLNPVQATDIPLEEFQKLAPGDVLFVDTTHTVKIAGDVNRIVLDVLPALAPGVFVHFHDIFMPWEYPRELLDRGFYWAEQYLLQAFLAFNGEFEPLLSAHWLHRREPEALESLIRSAPASPPPSSFWLRRAGA
jgi:hypothetical protein